MVNVLLFVLLLCVSLHQVSRINKSNMAKVKKELKWASIFQIAQSNHLDIVMASLSSVLAEINSELAVVEKGSDEYFRLTHLMTLFGGCYSAIRGADGIITGMVIDMLDGLKEK